MEAMDAEQFRALPAIDRLVGSPLLAAWEGRLTHAVRVRLAQELVDGTRERIRAGEPCPSRERLERDLEARFRELDEGGQRRALNGTGVVLHTNLGRAPLGVAPLALLRDELSGYSLLELDARTGERGDRAAFVERLARLVFGAPAALVVNNNAAAVYLALFALARGRGVLLSRGELVQIGGGFRIPDILEASGARLVEVGTTNITTLDDYRSALSGGDIALLMQVHRSNFRLEGHVASPSQAELWALAREAKLPLVIDLGSGAVEATLAGPSEPTVRDVLHAGVSLVCSSGDKLLGGPQAGLILGEASLVQALRRSPLYRAFRLGKTELFLLEQTLLDQARGRRNPTAEALTVSAERLRERAEALTRRLVACFPDARVIPGESSAGGGTTPAVKLPTWLVALSPADPEALARRLLARRPAVVVRRVGKRLLVDVRTLLPGEDEELARAMEAESAP